jgi:serine/threonine protein phosphatase Stp1
MTRTRHSALTHVGLVRRINEDNILALPHHGIWLVADGMGGHDAGDFASQTLVDAVVGLPDAPEAGELMQALRAAILRAHDRIRAEAARRGGVTIGATVVTLLIANAHFVAFWAGDSRLYRFRDGGIELLTTDHSAVAELVLAGKVTWDEADRLPEANQITRAVGVGERLVLDKIRGTTQPGDRFLLCTDGLTKYASFETLRRLARDTPIETVCERLLKVALAGGGADNISIIVVDIT